MPELKPITVIYPVMPAKDEAERAALRPIGRNRAALPELRSTAPPTSCAPRTNWDCGASPR